MKFSTNVLRKNIWLCRQKIIISRIAIVVNVNEKRNKKRTLPGLVINWTRAERLWLLTCTKKKLYSDTFDNSLRARRKLSTHHLVYNVAVSSYDQLSVSFPSNAQHQSQSQRWDTRENTVKFEVCFDLFMFSWATCPIDTIILIIIVPSSLAQAIYFSQLRSWVWRDEQFFIFHHHRRASESRQSAIKWN